MVMVMNEIGKNLKSHRLNHSLTQLQLAKQLHTTRQSVSLYETGVRTPDIYMLSKIADIYGMTVDELIGRKKRLSKWIE